jgi:hypothetical protein
VARLAALLAEEPALASAKMEHWSDHHRVEPLGYIAILEAVTAPRRRQWVGHSRQGSDWRLHLGCAPRG